MTDRTPEYEREARELLNQCDSIAYAENAAVPQVANWLRQRDQEHARSLTRLLQVAKDALGQVNELGIILSAGERLRAVIEEVENAATSEGKG